MGADKNHKIDSIDIKLLEQLEVNAKPAYTELTSELGMSRPAIQNRIQKLLDNRIVTIGCLVDPVALGYTHEITLLINTLPDKLSDVVEGLRSCPDIRYVIICTGRFGILAEAMFRNREQMSDFLVKDLRSIPGLTSVESMVTFRFVKISSTLLADDTGFRPVEKPRIDLDDLDRALIKKLLVDAKQSPSYLAGSLGTSESTVRRKIRKLLARRTIRIQGVVNPFALGYSGVASIGIKVDPARLDEAAEAVASYKHVQTVAICAGRYDILAWVVFRDMIDLEHFLARELSQIQGLRDIETTINLKTVKAA